MSTTTLAPPTTHRPRTQPWSAALLQLLRGWSYYRTADVVSRRDLRLDLLRGFCIFAMVVDHFGGDSWLYAITGGNRFYVSAAEGFIFISGFVMGQAYRSKRDRSGLPAAMGEALLRARTLYIATVALTLIFSVLNLYTDITLWTGRDFGLGIDSPQEIAVAAMTLHYTYHGTDILAMYTLLLLVAPLILLLLSTSEWYWVLGVSWLWWLAYQFYPEEASIPWYIRHGENFPLAAWQVLFVTGHVLGFYRDALAERLHRFRRLRVVLVALGLAATLALISLAWDAESGVRFGFFDIDPNVLDESFFKVPLRPWRLVAFLSVAIVAYTTATYLWVPIRRLVGWLMLPLGQAALYSYIVHFFLILLVYNLAPSFALLPWEPSEAVFTPILQIAVVMLLWLLVRRRVLFGIIPN
ncbi:MAG: OpgC domain-containing protein [Chloroflexi bacterium]|nr:OpgC domain-containing protein [Chloroflexota bacterium]